MPPIYTYRCPTCEQESEIRAPITDRFPDIFCPRCQGEMVRQVPRGTSFILKGSGWTPKGSE